MATVRIREATIDDCEVIFKWRNDELTRQMSHSSDVVEWDAHRVWFESSLSNKNRRLLVCLDNFNEKIAVVRVDIENEKATVSINLSPTRRGKGYAKKCLNILTEFIFGNMKNIKILLAEIKETNVASQKAFLGVGFTLYESIDGVGYYRKIIG